ncbi:hypothetical protein [Nocardia aurantia]|uniref:Uncharacterized protein n=1 Tax=Nocardia aurantia TaxID=2585199 RepID=A0A7K0DM61_9NOCA|nr:hypothetical protein [Nocardia aurantia]MQY26843.1 hypothetical protein [Nocardia aurantia]
MAVEQPAPEPSPQTPADPSPPPDPRNDTLRGARAATLTAILVAIISSVVAAGSAVYVSVHGADRSEHQALAEAIHSDREKIYSAYLASYFDVLKEISTLQGHLRVGLPHETVATRYQAFVDRSVEFYAASTMLMLVASEEVIDPVAKISSAFLEFVTRYSDFALKYLAPNAPGADDPTGWAQDSAALSTVIAGVLTKQQDLITPLLLQGRADLGR